MKNSRPLPYIIVALLSIIVIGGVLYLKIISPKYHWHENLNIKNDQPYGLSILYNLIKESHTEKKFHEIKNGNFEFTFNSNKGACYIYMGSNYYIDTINVYYLIEYIEQGHKAFISSTHDIEKFIAIWQEDSTLNNLINHVEKDSISTKLKYISSNNESTYTFHHQYLKKTENYPWPYFDSTLFDLFPNTLKVLSTIDGDKPNFVAINIDKGTLYLHTTPIFLSNYHIIREQTLTYLQSIWNEVTEDEIIWDSFSASPYSKSSYNHAKESPLRFILKHKSFRWAWFLFFSAIILFVLIQSKRKQNAIPLIETKENNTLEYAKAIGSLYFQAKSHKAIATEMMNQLYSFIKARYKIKIGKEKSKIIPNLSKVSGIKESKLSELFKLEIKLLYDQNAASEQLYKLYNLVDYFYKNCN